MSIKELIVYRAFREVNGFKSVPESCDTYVKLPKYKKQLLNSGVPAHGLAHNKIKQ